MNVSGPALALETPDQSDDVKLAPADEERIRILANLIIDRILEDYHKGSLKFTK